MASPYGFRAGPQFAPANRVEQFDAAMAAPLSIPATLWQQIGGSLSETFAGTIVRNFAAPPLAPQEPEPGPNPFGEMIQDVREGMNILTEADWKQGPYYREGIPFDPGMTAERAAVLAMWDDARAVREFYAEKRPITSFVGGFVGQALDPINYIPVAGSVVKAAAVAKLGRFGGAMATGALDAAGNTALAGGLSVPLRQQFGDDTSWQSQVSDIAMAALIGSAFGAVVGVFDGSRSRKAQAQLSTLADIQESRAVLNDAIAGIVEDGEIRLTPDSISRANQFTRSVAAREAAEPRTFSPEVDAPGVVGRGSTAVGLVLPDNTATMPSLDALLRQDALTRAPELRGRYEAAQQKMTDAEARVSALDEVLNARRESDNVSAIDEASADRLRDIEARLAEKPSAARAAELKAERDLIVESIGADAVAKIDNDFRIGPTREIKSARKAAATARREFSRVARELEAKVAGGMAINPQRFLPEINASRAAPELEPAEAPVMAAQLAKPEAYREIAAQHRVDAVTGAFPEQADLDRMALEGRVTEMDEAEIQSAEDEYQNGLSFSEALKSVVGCLL